MDHIPMLIFLVGAWLAAGAGLVNFLHWRRTGARGALFLFPREGVPRKLNVAWVSAQIFSMALFVAGLFSPFAFVALCVAWNIAVQTHSVWYRRNFGIQ